VVSGPDVLDLACRAWVPEAPGGDDSYRRRPRYLVVLDTETTTSVAQGLLVGAYRYVRVSWQGRRPSFSVVEEGLILPDDADEGTWALAKGYVASHLADVDPGADDASTVLSLRTRAEFCERVLWEACWRNRAWLVGFSLAFDLSRLARSWTEGRGRRRAKKAQRQARRGNRGAFVLRLWEWDGGDNRFRPNVAVTRLDGGRHLFSWGAVTDPPPDTGRRTYRDSHFLDLATLGFALTNSRASLEATCEAFGVPYQKRPVELGKFSADLIEYCREDVAATTELAGAMFGAFYAHPVPLDADRAYSPASIGLGYFARMGLRPPRAGTSALCHERTAQAQAAFYGQRMEAVIRHVPVPVVLVDFSSQYAVVAHLLGLWGLVTAERVLDREATEQVRQLLERVTLEDVLNQGTWPQLVGFALVEPEGDWLTRRAYFSGSGDVPRTSFGPTWSRPAWWALPDLVAAKLITGRAPEVLEAWVLVGEGRQALRRVRLGGKVAFDPLGQDWWLELVNARHRLRPEHAQLAQGLKVMANATAYGCWERHDRQDRAANVSQVRPDGARRTTRAQHPDLPHRWTFPPFASLVTAGGRLQMTVLEVLLRQQGGCWASANTDSAATVATESGGLVACPGGPYRLDDGTEAVRALPWKTLDDIRARLEPLNPLAGRDLLKLEPENFEDGDSPAKRRQLWVLASSGGRALYFANNAQGRPVVVKRNEHNLGELRSPTGAGREFLDDFALWALGHLAAEEAVPPAWWARPATYNFTASTPARLRQLGGTGTPFGFLMASSASGAGSVSGLLDASRGRRRAVAPLGPAGQAASAPWQDATTGEELTVLDQGEMSRRADLEAFGAERDYGANEVTLRTYGDVLRDWLYHPEAKMAGPEGDPCGRRTRGMLYPRAVREAARHYVGKESNLADEVEAGDVTDPDEVLADLGDDSWETLVGPVLQAMGWREVERRSGMKSERVGEAVRSARPRADVLTRLANAAIVWATDRLEAWGLPQPEPRSALLAPQSSLAPLAAYLAFAPERARPCACADGPDHPPARPGSPYCTEQCRRRAQKRRERAETNRAGEPGSAQKPEDK
jgi:hypothetical protein